MTARPLRRVVAWLAPALDRLARHWLVLKRRVLPEEPTIVPSLAWDVFVDGEPAHKERLVAFVREWYRDRPGELEALLDAILDEALPESRRRLHAHLQERTARTDGRGAAIIRQLGASAEAPSDSAMDELARSLVEPLTRDATGRHLEQVVECVLRAAPPALKQRFYGWIEDRALDDDHGIAYAEGLAEQFRREIEAHRGPLHELRVLELGPGHTLVLGVLLYVHGARSYTAVDLFPIASREAEVYRRVRRHIAERPLLVPAADGLRAEALRRFDEAVRLDGPLVVLDEAKVAFHSPVDAARLPFPDGSFDVVFSMAAFEHFTDPEAVVRECARVTAAGGIGLHQIDLRDHRDFARPFEFLRYSDEQWRKLHPDLFNYTNRSRKSDFERAFSASGFALRRVDVKLRAAVDAGLRASLDPRFRDRSAEDLEALSTFFVVERPRARG